jgi:Calcineurin-like phosphoesterase/Bacterial Ig-like domain
VRRPGSGPGKLSSRRAETKRALALAAVAIAAPLAAAPADAATRAPLPKLVRVGDPPARVAPGSAFFVRFRAVNRSRRTSARATVIVRLSGGGKRMALPGKAIVPALRRGRTYRAGRRYVLPAATAPGSYRVIACVKRGGVGAVCSTAARPIVVGGAPAGGGPAPAGGSPAPGPGADATAPGVAISSPSEGAEVTGRRPLVSGTAGTASGDERAVSVRFSGAGAAQTVSAAVGDDGRWSARPATDLAGGAWSAVAEQHDAAGNAGMSGSRGFRVPAVLLAAGDIAGCDTIGDEATALLLDDLGGDAVAQLGDLVYENGTPAEFQNCYGPTWGRHKARSRPAIGNHEYQTSGAAGYFGYFGSAAGDPSKGYYSYDLGEWHVVVLNSNCWTVPCGTGSAQANWLATDLAAHPAACTVAYWHHPVFKKTTSTLPTEADVRVLWDILDDAGADLVLNGHAHTYERYAPQHSDGVASTDGMRQIIVGTGGRSHHNLSGTAPNGEVHDNTTFGVLELTMRSSGYDWRFVPVAGGTFSDSGSDACR